MLNYRTPLRYPGGKQRLAPFVAEILQCNGAVGWNYAEPYAGGAGVAMELLLTGLVGRVYLNDSSRHVYAFWKSVVGWPDAFCEKISRVSLTVEEWKRHREVVRSPESHDVLDLGFSTFYLNRCNRSGILSGGVIGGLEQKGRWRLDARFPRNELITRVENIAALKARIVVTNMDAETFIQRRVNRLKPQTFVYCDPPYYERAERLYLSAYERKDHARVANVIQNQLAHPWIVSYDSHRAIAALYARRRKFRYSLHYSASRYYAGTELFIFADRLKVPRTSVLPHVAVGLRRLRRSA